MVNVRKRRKQKQLYYQANKATILPSVIQAYAANSCTKKANSKAAY